MNLVLKTTHTVKYSERETRIFDVLKKTSAKRPVTSEQLMISLYKGKEMPFHSRNATLCAIRSLKQKMVRNKERFRVASTKLRGPQPMEFWIEII